MKIRYRVPFIGRILLRLDAAIRIINLEWGGSAGDALAMIDDEARDMLRPKPFRPPPPPVDIPPYVVHVDWDRDVVENNQSKP